MVHGSWFIVLGSWFLVLGVHGLYSHLLLLEPRSLLLSSRYLLLAPSFYDRPRRNLFAKCYLIPITNKIRYEKNVISYRLRFAVVLLFGGRYQHCA